MIVFKFGGASVKDASGVKNLLNIIQTCSNNLIIVVSALGKTTNALEEILHLSLNESEKSKSKLQDLKNYHFEIINNLFPDKKHEIYNQIEEQFQNLIVEL
jgi:aspartate kinase